MRASSASAKQRARNATAERLFQLHRCARSALLCGLLAAAMLAIAATSASAVVVQVGETRIGYFPVSAVPLNKPQTKNKVKPVTYHGGPVMPSNTNYTLYWDPAGAPAFPSGYTSGINRYLEDLAHDSGGVQNTDSVLTQYGDNAGEFANYNSHFGGSFTDTDAYPANGCSAAPTCFSDEQLQAEITTYVEAHKLPTDLTHEYLLITPPGIESCKVGLGCSVGSSDPIFCAYHSFIPVSHGVIVYANIPYTVVLGEAPYCDTGEEHPNNSPSDAAIGGGLAHEHDESVTDPELNAWYDSKGNEVADKCRTHVIASEFGEPLGAAPDGSNYNQIINGDLYWYQQVWSNEAGACEQRSGSAVVRPTATGVSPKIGPASGGTLVTITGTGFSAPATVRFGAATATEVSVKSATSISARSPAGSGTVFVTVKTSGGTSANNKKARFKYK